MQRNAETIKRTRSRYRQCNSSANLCVAASLRPFHPSNKVSETKQLSKCGDAEHPPRRQATAE